MPRLVRPGKLVGRRRQLVAAGVVVLVLAGGGAAFAATRSSSSAAATATTTLVAASTSTLRQTVTTTGTIEPATEADLSFAVSGTVTAVPAKVGSKVAKGTVLATVDPTDLQAAVATAQAGVDAANTQLSSVSGGTSAEIAAAQAQLASADDSLTTAEKALAAARLTSPIAGTVAAVSVAIGDQVGSGSSGTSGSGGGSGSGTSGGTGTSGGSGSSSSSSTSSSSSAQIVVISTGSWIVNASVGSADLPQLRAGLQAELIPSGTTTRVFGVVKSVGVVASSSSGGSATFPVTITVTGSPTGLYSGGSADVTIIVKQLQDVLTVPTLAVKTVNGSTVVTRSKNGKQSTVAVKVGAVYGASTQVLSGIQAGDQVVVTSAAGRPGATPGSTRARTGTGGFGGTGFGGTGFGGGTAGQTGFGGTGTGGNP